ncbi:7-carboxy-7-deazaguanine synthase QueE [Parabacteroides bouchesdurhonensis]|uniref:7-carboxy-7-deazaguanine synthase QueE n=1 Tax=Parabacteroides bouchesdurhonensis TaxID=1936995 RepID=UPI000E4A526E|nr:7-carboxy-7-deazaguanine synthase QueE [Parabacteroides bouchesdurhonensis]RHJ90395.1 radical SAM protein [Bacteroides sp. AM07-16]
MKKINEIFYSLQGEGFHTGTPAIFIRFSGCNLKCDFCDTQHEAGTLMSDEDILTAISTHPAQTVILTGGEPSLWINTDFIELLHKAGKYVCIETNGTNILPSTIDWVTCSPKQNSRLEITHANEIKVVYTGQDLSPYLQISADHYYLQPCSCQNTQEVINYILTHPEWKLSLQTHKLIHIQ